MIIGIYYSKKNNLYYYDKAIICPKCGELQESVGFLVYYMIFKIPKTIFCCSNCVKLYINQPANSITRIMLVFKDLNELPEDARQVIIKCPELNNSSGCSTMDGDCIKSDHIKDKTIYSHRLESNWEGVEIGRIIEDGKDKKIDSLSELNNILLDLKESTPTQLEDKTTKQKQISNTKYD